MSLKNPLDPSRVLPFATPRMLAFVRIVVCAVLLVSVCWERLASSALLPPGMRQPEGLIWLFQQVAPGAFDWLCSTPWALGFLQVATGAAIFATLVGYHARFSAVCGAALYLLMGGLLRQYAWFYHTGLVPAYALLVLAFTPCGVAWSVDRWRSRRRGLPPAPDGEPRSIDAWSVYAVWIAVAVPYVMAGLSKVRAGAGWFDPRNFKAILLTDTLNPMHFDFDYSLRLTSLPDWVFGLMAVAGVAGELAMGGVLLSRAARRIVPVAMTGMHVAIWLLQRVLFFDLILLQLIFVVPPRWFADRRVARNLALPPTRWPRPILALILGLAMIWLGRIERYPLTDMHMYTSVNRSGVIEYHQLIAHRVSGEIIQPKPEKVIPAVSDTRYRRVLGMAMRPPQRGLAGEFFATCGRLFNEKLPPEERIIAFEVIRKRWNFIEAPADPEFGETVESVRFDLVTTEASSESDER